MATDSLPIRMGDKGDRALRQFCKEAYPGSGVSTVAKILLFGGMRDKMRRLPKAAVERIGEIPTAQEIIDSAHQKKTIRGASAPAPGRAGRQAKGSAQEKSVRKGRRRSGYAVSHAR